MFVGPCTLVGRGRTCRPLHSFKFIGWYFTSCDVQLSSGGNTWNLLIRDSCSLSHFQYLVTHHADNNFLAWYGNVYLFTEKCTSVVLQNFDCVWLKNHTRCHDGRTRATFWSFLRHDHCCCHVVRSLVMYVIRMPYQLICHHVYWSLHPRDMLSSHASVLAIVIAFDPRWWFGIIFLLLHVRCKAFWN